MKLSGIFVLALLAAAVVAQKAPVESLEEIKFKIVITKMAQEPMFESVGFLKLIKIAKKVAPLVVRDNQSFDEINWKIIITKLAQENQEMNSRRNIPVKEDPELIKIHIVIGKMAQEPLFEQLNFGKVIKIAKKIAPLVLEKNSESIDQLKWKVIISKMSAEKAWKPVLPHILRSEAPEQGAKEVIKKIINGIIHFIVKSEEPLDELKWKVIITKMTEEIEATESPENWKIIISKMGEELETAEAPEQGAKEVIKKIINGIIHFIVKSEEPLDELKWKVIISKMNQELESVPKRPIRSLRADAPEHNIIAKILKKVIINGVIHWINTRSTLESVEAPENWKIIISKMTEELESAEAQEQGAKEVIKKIINGIIHFIVKSEEPLEDWKIIISKMGEQLESRKPEVPKRILPILKANSAEQNIIGKILKKVIINGVIHWINTRSTLESAEAPENWKIIISKMTEELESAEANEQGAKEVIKKIINGIIHFIVKADN